MSENYVEIMLQSLRKKEAVLEEIIRLNLEQKDTLEDPAAEPDTFDALVEKKGDCIAQLEQLDSGFEKLFERTREVLDRDRLRYTAEIKEMQEHIRRITDKSVEVQAQEARNKDLMMQKFAIVRRQAKELRASSAAVSRYYQSMGRAGSVEPQFLDGKH